MMVRLPPLRARAAPPAPLPYAGVSFAAKRLRRRRRASRAPLFMPRYYTRAICGAQALRKSEASRWLYDRRGVSAAR